MTTRYRNFDAVRLYAASSVVFSHSFLIATGVEATEPLKSTGLVTGVYGVFVFFILSGFLVTESAQRSATIGIFVRNRFLRIMPALVSSTLLVGYVLCPLFATNGALAFIADQKVFIRVIEIITFHSDNFYFPNLAFYPPLNKTDWLPGVANGVLWTIRWEVTGYLFIGLMATASLLKPKPQSWIILLATLAALVVLSFTYGRQVSTQWISELLFVVPSLCCGIFMTWLVRRHRPRGWIALVLMAGVVPATYFHVLPEVFPFLVAYPVIWLGSAPIPLLPRFYEKTDISYGIYLYGWPVIQVLRHFVGPHLSGYELAALALPVTILVAWLSWRFIEKPALGLKTSAKQQMLPANPA
ncbi:MAG: acyltransferase [Burkholderiaceae bacterium]|jgi:peptidoglycan/LPS O-acetylase OafA/YrhL|nr:acyltransferase [Burkholderiaceae bacterium]